MVGRRGSSVGWIHSQYARKGKRKIVASLVSKKSVTPTLTSMNELYAQIALGTLKDDRSIASVVKVCKDPEIVKWASCHPKAMIRAAAASTSVLSFGVLMRFLFLDKTAAVQKAAATTLGKYHFATLQSFLDQIEDYPQTSFVFPESPREVDPKAEAVDSKTYAASRTADAVQVAREAHARAHAKRKKAKKGQTDVDSFEEEEDIW